MKQEVLEAWIASSLGIAFAIFITVLAICWLVLPFILMSRLRQIKEAINQMTASQSNAVSLLSSINGAAKRIGESSSLVAENTARLKDLAEWDAQRKAGVDSAS